MDRVSLRTLASGSGRPVRGPHPRDITAQTRTPATLGADGTVILIHTAQQKSGLRTGQAEDRLLTLL